MKKVILAAAILLIFVVACQMGSKSKESPALRSDMYKAAVTAAPSLPPEPAPSVEDKTYSITPAETEGEKPASPRPAGTKIVMPPKIIRNATLSIRSEDLDSDIQKIESAIKESGGYVAASKADRKSEIRKYAHLSVRLPAEKLDDFLLFLQTGFKVEEIATSSQDVTEEYMDLQSRIANAKREEGRLLELLESRTGKLSDVLEVERELVRVREYIESMEGKIRYFDNRVSLSTVVIELRQEKEMGELRTSWWSDLTSGIKLTFKSSIYALGRSVQSFIIFLFAVLPWLVFFFLVGFVVWRVLRFRKRRKSPAVPPSSSPGAAK